MHTADHHAMRVLVLGPLALVVQDEEVAVPGTKRRTALALLTLAEGAVVSTTDLVDALWPDAPPDNARAALQSHVSRLRGHLGGAGVRLTAERRGYRLRLEPGELDVQLARDALTEARRVAEGDPGGAATRLAAARGLWRGRPLAEFLDVPSVASHCLALDDLCHAVDTLLVVCALRAGDVEAAVQAATTAATDRPTSEGAALLRVEALTAAGRPADALRAAAELRHHLRDELGVEPTAALTDLERAVATGNPTTSLVRSDSATTAPSRATRASATPIPRATVPLIGRDGEVGALRRLLEAERLVTVVGTGGVGKTRLAADVARRHDGTAHWTSLSSITGSGELPLVLASALGLERLRGDALEACANLLAAGDHLLVVDNCEHVLDDARDAVARLLRACPTLTVLTTSRERLGLAEECAFRLGPLAVPAPSSAHPERAPAMALLVDRARRARPGFDLRGDDVDVAVGIVRRLDGLPLAIELAAGRLSFLDVRDLGDRLDRALDLLQGGRGSNEARHQTLRDTLAWSYDLLPPDRQALLQHLAVFPDGVDLRTAERVAVEIDVDGDPAAALGHLVDASLLEAELDDAARYRMLETLRTFALERLDASSRRDAAEVLLLRWAEELASWVDETLHTEDEAVADARLRRELANLRAAWALARQRGALDAAIAIIAALDDAAQWRDLPEVWSWAQTLVDDPALATHPRRAAALATASDFAWLKGDLRRATELAQSAVECPAAEEDHARALLARSVAHLSGGEFHVAADLALEAADAAARPEHARLVAALATAYAGDVEGATAINATALPPAGLTQQAEWEYTAAELASIAGRLEDAERHYRRSIELAGDVGATFVVGIATVGLLTVLRATGRHREALHGYRDVLVQWQRAGNWIQVWTTLRNLADLLIQLDDVDTARAVLTVADHDPDGPVVGDAAWGRRIVEPEATTASPVGTWSRDDVVALAVAAVDRLLGDGDGCDAAHEVR